MCSQPVTSSRPGGPELADELEESGYDAYLRKDRFRKRAGMTDFAAIRKEFPILDQEIHGHPLVYLDSAATSQKPQCVIDAESDFYRTINAGVHRGAHELAARSTMAFEEARAKVARLVGANSAEGEEEIVVTSGATAGLNLLATAFGNASLGRGGEAARRFAVKPGDEIVVSKAEHPLRAIAVPGACRTYRSDTEMV